MPIPKRGADIIKHKYEDEKREVRGEADRWDDSKHFCCLCFVTEARERRKEAEVEERSVTVKQGGGREMVSLLAQQPTWFICWKSFSVSNHRRLMWNTPCTAAGTPQTIMTKKKTTTTKNIWIIPEHQLCQQLPVYFCLLSSLKGRDLFIWPLPLIPPLWPTAIWPFHPTPLTTPLPQPHFRPPLFALSLALWQPLLLHVTATVFVPTVPKIKPDLFLQTYTAEHAGSHQQPSSQTHPLSPPSLGCLCGGFLAFFFISALTSWPLPPHHHRHHTYTGFFFFLTPLIFSVSPELCTYPILPSI